MRLRPDLCECRRSERGARPHARYATAPRVGSVLASYSGPGRVNVIASTNGGFSVVDSIYSLRASRDESTITTYSAFGKKLMQLPPGQYVGECGAADLVVPTNGRLIIAEQALSRAAKGINPAEYSVSLHAWNASSGKRVWTSTLVPWTQGYAVSADDCTAYDGELQDFTSTDDGRWGFILDPYNGGTVVNLATGALRHDANAIGVIGNYVVDAGATGGTDPITNPQSAALVGPGYRVPYEGPGGNLAPGGVFYTDDDSQSPSSGTTSDGTHLIALQGDDESTITAFSLPGSAALWSLPSTTYGPYPWIAGDGGGVLIVTEGDCQDLGDPCVVALNDASGAKEWSLAVPASLCGITSTQMLVLANGQEAVINLKTGKQVSYDSRGDCLGMLPGGITVEQMNSGQRVVVRQA